MSGRAGRGGYGGSGGAGAGALGLVLALALGPAAAAQVPGEVVGEVKISDTSGGFTGKLANNDQFGRAVAGLGDVDGDGVNDLLVGASGENSGGGNAVWVLLMRDDGTVKEYQQIGDGAGNAPANLQHFGRAVASLGDLDGDGVCDIAVGDTRDDDGASDAGAVWILFLSTEGDVKSSQKISATSGGFGGTLSNNNRFGMALAAYDDLNGDGVPDLAVGTDDGEIWNLFLETDGTVQGEQLISATVGGFDGSFNGGPFGESLAVLDDLDGDGVEDLLTGARHDDDGGQSTGAVWILFLNANGTVAAETKISDLVGGFLGPINDEDNFGASVAALGDLDGDLVEDIAVGAPFGNDGNDDAGTVWILFLQADGTAKDHLRISNTSGGLSESLPEDARFGASLGVLDDVDGDDLPELVAGLPFDDDDNQTGNSSLGAALVLFLDGTPPVLSGDVWTDLGKALAGTGGIEPSLVGDGTLQGGDPLTLTLTDAVPASTAWLVVGFSELCAPFRDGFMVPTPDLVLPPLPTVFGTVVLPATWPAGIPSGVTVWFQFWIADPGGPQGFSASNGIAGTTP